MGKVVSFIKHNKNLMVFGLVLAFGIFAPDAFAGVTGQGLKEMGIWCFAICGSLVHCI